ncbi:uncharacterized protein LOC135495805 isoform X2 [Lineus longissimus]|uniref:uncharacterized protein LOC135495805 isoform X2 n=1 Tax=Lineus longissimus TaxID=88925 RepID=UPI00315CC28D
MFWISTLVTFLFISRGQAGLAAVKPRSYQGPVAHVTSSAGKYKIPNWAEARTTCGSRGLRLATREQLETAWKDGMDVCACGWLADGFAAFLSSSCGSIGRAGVTTCKEPEVGKGWDAFCIDTPILVVHVQESGRSSEIPTWEAAVSECASQGMRLATRDQLTEAWRQGLDVCACGWLADGSVGYPILNPRDGCGNSAAGIRTCSRIPFNAGWDAYCTKAELPVIHVTDDGGSYKIASWEDARRKCTSRGMRLATRGQLTDAWKQGLDVCSCGWLADGTVGYPILRTRNGCEGSAAGVTTCSSSIGGGAGWDAYCTKIEIPVVHKEGDGGRYTITDWSSADRKCASLGMRLATREQLTEAWEQGLDVCYCGWLADGSVGYPILRPRNGCGGSSAGIRTCSRTPPSGAGWDAYCTKSPLPVVHVKDNEGSYRIANVAAAASKCASIGMRLATRDQLTDAWKLGLDKCLCGWLADGSVGYPIWVPRSGCGDSVPGIRTCPSTPGGEGWDAYCTKSELPVAWVTEKEGSYKIRNASDAAAVCASVGMRLATYDQLREAWRQGMDNCNCGWLADGTAGYPILRPRISCGTAEAGIRVCSGLPRDGWDAYCTKSEVPVVYSTDKTGSHEIKTWESAAILCISRGMRLATRDQLTEAWKQGLDVCACGWLADGTVGYPIWRPRDGCGGNATAGVRACTSTPPGDGWDAYCTKSKLPVIHIANETGTYQIPNVVAAVTLCADRGMRLATFDQLRDAWKQGLDQCTCGWLADGRVGYPILKPRENCGGPTAGVRTCSNPIGGGGWDAYCTDIELPVVHVLADEGQNKIPTAAAAATKCASRGMRLATRGQLREAWKLGMDVCSCGWLADGTAGFPIMRSREGCGGATSTPGLRTCHVYPNGLQFDAFCTKLELPVVRVVAVAGGHKIPSWEAAVKECADRGMRLATPDQLEDARWHGFDACYCGWLADGSVGYPILRPRDGCGLHRAGIRVCPSRPPSGAGWDAYCIKTKVPVVHLIDKAGRYKIPTWAAAVSKCASEGMRLATRDQLQEARNLGFDACACGWTADGSVMYPIVRPRDGCGVGPPAIRICTTPPSPGWDAYCTKAELPVVHITDSSGNHEIKTWDAAVRLCASRGMRLATCDQLDAARLQGLDVCFCGWLADGTVGYPVVKPRQGCGSGSGRAEIATCSSTPPRDAGYDAFCTNSEIPVVHVENSTNGSHEIPTYEHAKHECAVRGMKLASRAQLTAAWKQGLDVCACGWLANGTVGFPIVKQREGCGPPGKPYEAGVRTCSSDPASAGNPGWDAYCISTDSKLES